MEMVASSTAVALHGLGRASRSPVALPRRRLNLAPASSIRYAAAATGRMRARAQCCRLPSPRPVEDRSLADRIRRVAAVFLGSSAILLAAGMNSCGFARAEEAAATATTTATTNSVEKQDQGKGGGDKEKKKKPSRRRKTREEEEQMLDELTRLHGFMEKRDMPSAIKALSKLIEMNPQQLEFRFIRGHAYEYIGDLDNALKEFEDVLEMDPLSVRGLQGLALVLRKQNKDIDFIRKIVLDAAAKATEENRPKAARNFRMLHGQILTLKEQLPEALELYQQLSKEDPTDFRPYVCQGLVCCMLGELDQAEEHFSNFESYCPQTYEGRDAIEDLIDKARSDAKDRTGEESSSKVAAQ